MSKTYNVAVLVGSLRKASINRKLALALADLAPASLNLEILEIGDLPLYNEDADGDTAPASYAPFRSKLKAADAVLFVTPEYNRSIPGVLKNAIDVGSPFDYPRQAILYVASHLARPGRSGLTDEMIAELRELVAIARAAHAIAQAGGGDGVGGVETIQRRGEQDRPLALAQVVASRLAGDGFVAEDAE